LLRGWFSTYYTITNISGPDFLLDYINLLASFFKTGSDLIHRGTLLSGLFLMLLDSLQNCLQLGLSSLTFLMGLLVLRLQCFKLLHDVLNGLVHGLHLVWQIWAFLEGFNDSLSFLLVSLLLLHLQSDLLVLFRCFVHRHLGLDDGLLDPSHLLVQLSLKIVQRH